MEEDDNLIDEDSIRYIGHNVVNLKNVKNGRLVIYGAAKLKGEENKDTILLLGKVAEKLDKPIQE